MVLIDDRPVFRLGLRATLSGTDLEIVAEGSTAEAAALARSREPDVIVYVASPGDPDPFRSVAALRALEPDPYVLVVADELTEAAVRDGLVAGATGFLLANAPLAEVRRAVAATARGERVLSAEIAMQLTGARHGLRIRDRPTLTMRELDVLENLAAGLTNREIAERLELSPRTVKTQVQNLLVKLDAPDRTGAVANALRRGLIR